MKKVLSIVLSIAMVVCLAPTMAFAATTSASSSAAYSDIEGTACEGAVNVLTALKVVDGFTDGTYKPEQTVTRAQMAKLVVTALGVADYATAKTSKYTDMGSATWAIPYVEYASNLNIVNGVGNGKFNPNGTVTYEQAATMIVRALGYTDQCKEMNGTWPAIYVQKAMALGIFEDVVNGGANGANRGDIAIMLFNAIDLPEVYADGDGATQYKSGSTTFTGNDNKTFKGTSMLATLNKDGRSEYKIVDEDDADNAVYNIRSYVGLAGKVYTNKDGDVISVGDLQSTALTGTFNSKYDEFTVGDKTYKVANDALKHVVEGSSWSVENVAAAKGETSAKTVAYFDNGEVDSAKAIDSKDDLKATVKYNKKITLGAKVSGSTITQIHSVSVWNATSQDLFETSDASVISKSHKLFGKAFDEDDNKDIDYTSFELVGVDSLDKIAEDNVVAVFANGDTIRKVEVGTEKVTGTFEEFSEGTVAKDQNNGKPATATIAGKTYKTSKAASAASDDITSWLAASDNDSVSVGDEITAYLNASGAIFKVELSSASASNYAMVLDYAITYGTATATEDNSKKVVNDQSLNGNDSKIKVMTSTGEVVTLTFKNKADIVGDNGKAVNAGTLSVGDIITYDLNSSKAVKKVTIKSDARLDSTDKHDITAKGYYDGTAIADNATIFTIDDFTTRTSENVNLIPDKYIDSDDADVTKLDSLKDTDNVTNYAKYLKSGRYAAMVINGDATSNDEIFGVITGYSKLGSDDASGCDYKVQTIVNGEAKTYYYDGTDLPNITNLKTTIFRFKLNASGNITALYDADNAEFEGTVLGYATAGKNGITFKNNSVETNNGSKSIDSDAVFYKYSADNNKFDTCYKADIESADAGKYAILIDTDTGSDKDKVADVVLLVNKDQLKANLDDVNTAEFEVAAVAAKAKDFTSSTANSKQLAITEAENSVKTEGITVEGSSKSESSPYTVTLTIQKKDKGGKVLATATAIVNVTYKPVTSESNTETK